MKKSLLIILSLIFMNMSAHAVGVDCWEEVSATFNPSTVSKMQAVLGNNVTITKVKTVLSISGTNALSGGRQDSTELRGWQQYAPLTGYLYQIDTNGTKTYLDFTASQPTTCTTGRYDYCPKFSSGGGGIGQVYSANSDYSYALGFYNPSIGLLIQPYYSSGNSGYYGYYNRMALGYIHTYCIENTNSGGGGGTSGASVNYIIKAN